MNKSLSYAVALLMATITVSFGGPDKAAMEAKEKTAWQTFKDKDAAGFQKVVDKDFKGVYADGIYDMQKEMADMKRWDMKSFAINDYTIFSDEKDVVGGTYTGKVEGTVEGKDVSGTYNCGSCWKMKTGKWMAIYKANVK